MKRFQDRVAIVTGAGRANGIGEAIALRLASEGASIAIVDIGRQIEKGEKFASEEEIQSVAEKLRKLGAKTLAVTANVTVESEVQAMVEKVYKEFGRIDVLFNNAAGASRGGPIQNTPLIDLDREAWDYTLGSSLTSAFLCSKHAAHKMIEGKRGGAIVNTISISAYYGQPGLGAYSAAKIGVNALTRTMAIELAPHNIRVNAFSPGMVATQWLSDRFGLVVKERKIEKSTDEYIKERAAMNIPLQRPGAPSELASAATFLASDDASYMTGQMLFVDGGMSAK
jgi:3-oxoacyl-[acyl-carrier protein] reductase